MTKQRAFDIAFENCTGMTREKARKQGIVSDPETARYKRYRKVVYVDPLRQQHTTTAYLFDFSLLSDHFVTHVFTMVDTNTGQVLWLVKQLLSNTNINMKGSGGNILVGRRTYGEGDWSGRLLNVTKKGNMCLTSNPAVEVNSLHPSLPNRPTNRFPILLCMDENNNEPVKQKCNPKSPNIDETDTSYSQVSVTCLKYAQFSLISPQEFRKLQYSA